MTRNGSSGVWFRKETLKNSGHRNTFRNNKVLDNGNARAGYGFYISPSAGDLVIEKNHIAETRPAGGTQRIGVYKESGAGVVRLRDNTMAGNIEASYREGAPAPRANSR